MSNQDFNVTEAELINTVMNGQAQGAQGSGAAKPKEKAAGGGVPNDAIIGELIDQMLMMVNSITGTMGVLQERFVFLTNEQSSLANNIPQPPTNNDQTAQDAYQTAVLQYQGQLSSVENQQHISTMAMQGAANNVTTTLQAISSTITSYTRMLASAVSVNG